MIGHELNALVDHAAHTVQVLLNAAFFLQVNQRVVMCWLQVLALHDLQPGNLREQFFVESENATMRLIQGNFFLE